MKSGKTSSIIYLAKILQSGTLNAVGKGMDKSEKICVDSIAKIAVGMRRGPSPSTWDKVWDAQNP